MGKPGKTWAEIVEIGNMVGGLEHGFYDFLYIVDFISPTDKFIFFRGVGWNHQPDDVLKFEPPKFWIAYAQIWDHRYRLAFVALRKKNMAMEDLPFADESSTPWWRVDYCKLIVCKRWRNMTRIKFTSKNIKRLVCCNFADCGAWASVLIPSLFKHPPGLVVDFMHIRDHLGGVWC